MHKPAIKSPLSKVVFSGAAVILIAFIIVAIKAHTSPEFFPGDYVTFGRYWQTSGQTKEPIMWRVLEANESELYLVSDKILFFAPFDDAPSEYSLQQSGFGQGSGFEQYAPGYEYSSHWEDSTIRAYLNGIDTSDPVLHPHIGRNCTQDSFQATAFTEKEWGIIKETVLVDEATKEKARDKIFLLDILEVKRFFPGTNDRWVQMTSCAKTQFKPEGVDALSAYIRGYGSWFAKDYYDPHLVAAIEDRGRAEGGWWAKEPNGIRPALKLDLNAENVYAFVKLTKHPAPVPLLEETIMSLDHINVVRADTFVQDYVEMNDAPVSPTFVNSSLMLPFRYVCETALQGTVTYEADTNEVTAQVKGHELVMRINDPIMFVDGNKVDLSQPPTFKDGHIIAPLDVFEPIVTSIRWVPEIAQIRIIP